MNKSLNIDAAVEHIINLVDSIRCALCENTDGTRMRYACEHTCCDGCVIPAVECPLCLTPPSRGPVADEPFTQRAQNAVTLLNAFQNEFHIDVHKRQRLSEQLKVEKELFPECIQAPAKYFNKRKSFKNTKSNKENRLSQLPGEEVSSIWHHKMDQSNGNVEQWLNKYVRKPLTDLNSNDDLLRRNYTGLKKQYAMDIENENVNINVTSRKRPHNKSCIKNKLLLGKSSTPVKQKDSKKPKLDSDLSSICDTSNDIKASNNTGQNISTDSAEDEAVIVIEDSQSSRVEDKDYAAWLAVQEAEKQTQDLSKRITTETNKTASEVNLVKPTVQQRELITKVPFYLIGSLADKWTDCNRLDEDTASSHMMEQTQDLLITIKNKTFTTTIKVSRLETTENLEKHKQSVEIQTDEIKNTSLQEQIHSENILADKHVNGKEQVMVNSSIKACNLEILDLFTADRKMSENKETSLNCMNKTGNVYIGESDSDEELEASVSLEVTADIHRSCENIDYGILADVDNIEEHSKRARRAARGATPNSSDSSDKENYNPNRQKKMPSSKKKPMKK